MATYSKTSRNLIRLFGEAGQEPSNGLWIPWKMVLINVTAALACVCSAFLWFGVAFAAEESYAPRTAGVTLLLWSIALALAILGAGVGATTRSFPWLAAVLTPLLMGLIMELSADRDIYLGLQLGFYVSVVFVAGALSGRVLRRWARSKKASN